MEGWRDNITPEDVRGRSEAGRILTADPDSALRIARAIRHPWYRCQAIAGVAEVQHSAKVRQALLEESLAAAYEQTEPNRIVSVASWPLRQLVATQSPIATDVVGRLLTTISKETHGLRKLDGLANLLITVVSTVELRSMVMPLFNLAASASSGWRTERIVADCACALAEYDPAAAMTLAQSRPPNRFAIRTLAKLQKQEIAR